MDGQQNMLDDTDSEFLTLTYVDQALDPRSEQLSNDCTHMILDSNNCQNSTTMTPLNDLLLGQTYIIETSEEPVFVNGTQLITFQHINLNGQIENIQEISSIDSENIDFALDSDDQFQDTYTNFNKISSSIGKMISANNILKDNSTDIDITTGNYKNSPAINILDDIVKVPIDTNYLLDIHKEHCMQESLTNLDEEGPSNICYKTCKTCKKSLSTLSEYKAHIKEHKLLDLMLKKQNKFTVKFKKKVSNSIKRFKCDQCDWSFNKSNLLRRHVRTHTGEKPFKCSYCSGSFTQHNSLNRHLLKHKGLRPFRCELCEMNFSQKGHLINHMKRCHAVTKEATRIHTCSMCSCVFNSINALTKHLNGYHGLNLKTKNSKKNVLKQNVSHCVETDDISKTINLTKDPSSLQKWLEEVAHELQIVDNNIDLNHCNNPISTQCEFELNLIENDQFDEIDNNILQISNTKKKESERLADSTQKGGHKQKQSSLNYVHVSRSQGKEHIISTNINRLVPSSIKETIVKKNDSEVRTNVNKSVTCSEKKTTNKLLVRKKKKCSAKNSKIDTKTMTPKKTKTQTLNSKDCIINHLPKSNTNHTTTKTVPKAVHVPNITTNSEDLNVQKPQPKICQFCGKIFKKNADLERHERTHTGDKPYRCDIEGCNKAFATKCSLDYHLITHEGKMKRAMCPQCNGLFATTSSMKVHMRQHTGEKPFKCPVCGDSFRTSGHLHTHVAIHERKNKKKTHK